MGASEPELRSEGSIWRVKAPGHTGRTVARQEGRLGSHGRSRAVSRGRDQPISLRVPLSGVGSDERQEFSGLGFFFLSHVLSGT